MSAHPVAAGSSQAFVFTPTTPSMTEDINVTGSAAVDITVQNPQYPMTINILSLGDANNPLTPTSVTAAFHMSGFNFLKVEGNATTTLVDNSVNDLAATHAVIVPTTTGTGTFNLTSSGYLEFGRLVGKDITINLNEGLLKLDRPADFQAAVTSSDGEIVLDGLIDPTAYDVANGKLTIYNTVGTAIDTLRFTDTSPTQTGLAVRLIGGEVQVIEQSTLNGADPSTLGGTALTQHVAPAPAPQVVAVHDNTTGADLPDMSTHYTGPVAGLVSQFINVTPDNLNIAAMADGLFIKTGAGNDAVALRGGTNVVDCGAGSNFVTSGSGFDTFFLDARNIPAAASAAGPVPGAIWDTISNFHSSDAATLWGITPGTALAWQKNEGAVGHTGLTLHANMPNGSEASLTLAGIDSKAGLQLSYGSVGGSSYLYVKAA